MALRIRLNADTGLSVRLRGAFGPLLALILIFTAGPALAQYSYTPYDPDPDTPSELSHEEILELTYGGDFVPSGLNFSNGTVTAMRVWDTNLTENTVDIVTGDYSQVDQVWSDGAAYVTAIARYAALDQSFGWNGGGLGTSTYIELLTDADIGNPVGINITGDFLWGFQPNSSEWWSLESVNADGQDHMISYMILGLILPNDPTVWMVFHEDLTSPGWDQDYNDIVVEFRATPEPSALLLLGAGLLGLVVARRARSSA